MNNQIFNLPVHSGENSTYNLKFRAPQLRCTSPPYYNNTYPLEYHRPLEIGGHSRLVTPVFVSRWEQNLQWYQDSQDAPLYSIAKHVPLNFTARRTSENVTSFEVFRTTAEMTCKPQSVLYDVKVSFPRGIQTVQHTTSDMKMLSAMREYSDDTTNITQPVQVVWGESSESLSPPLAWLGLPSTTQSLQDWNHRMRILLPLATEWALLDALRPMLEDKFYAHSTSFSLDPGNSWCEESDTSTNGTTSFDCGEWIGHYFLAMNTSSKFECTVCSECRT
jgi:hypothetical protein